MVFMGINIFPVILSGGMGTRLWPMSRGNYPKQFINLFASKNSLIQETVMRVSDNTIFNNPIIISNIEHRFLVAEQLSKIGASNSDILLEPIGKNTAPAIAAAASYVNEKNNDEDALILVLPSDHVIKDNEKFIEGIKRAAEVAKKGYLVTFGIKPDYPETGYGYIKNSDPIEGVEDSYKVQAFVEKPCLETAEKYVDSGNYYWNSGMFMFPVKLLKEELNKYCQEIYNISAQSVKNRVNETDFIRLSKRDFSLCPAESIDYAVMENTDKAAVVAIDCDWSDAGSWESLWNISEKDNDNNVILGENFTVDTKDCYISSKEGAKIVTVGLKDIIVVSTKDAILVADKKSSQKVKDAVSLIRSKGSGEIVSNHNRVYRPWGYYENINEGQRHQVKRINVKPNAKLSLQMHYHRAEHWVVVRGTAKVTRGDEIKLLSENQSIYIPNGVIHCVENPGKIDLEIIEVQSGSYLGEDDIVRFEDNYGRSDNLDYILRKVAA